MQNQDKLGAPFYADAAAQLKLDQAAFGACQETRPHAARIQASFDEGAAAGVDGIPYFFVNGRSFSGAVTADQLETALNSK
jgi:protein-disulfide isomerase